MYFLRMVELAPSRTSEFFGWTLHQCGEGHIPEIHRTWAIGPLGSVAVDAEAVGLPHTERQMRPKESMPSPEAEQSVFRSWADFQRPPVVPSFPFRWDWGGCQNVRSRHTEPEEVCGGVGSASRS